MKTKLSSPTRIMRQFLRYVLWFEVDSVRMAPLDDNYGIENFPQAEADKLAAMLADFMKEALPLLETDQYDDAAYYFWGTLSGSGSSFLDVANGEGAWENAEALYQLAHKWRDMEVYTSRGWIYCY